MSRCKILILSFFNWNYRFFLSLIIFNIIFGCTFTFYKEYKFIQGLIAVILFGLSIYFWVSSTLLSSSNSNSDGFSLKYLRSLPFSKNEILFSYGVISILMAFPFLVYTISYFDIFTNFKNPVASGIKFFLVSLISLFVFGLTSIDSKLMYPKNGYFEAIFRKHSMLYLFKWFVFGCTVMTFSLVLAYYLKELTGIDYPSYIDRFFDGLFYIFKSWYLVPVLFVFAISYFNKILSGWDKKDFYKKVFWKPKKDIFFIGSSILANVIVIVTVIYSTPVKYKGSELLTAIYKNDQKQFEKFVKDLSLRNSVNKYGYSPIMVAAREGRKSMFFRLKEEGAFKDGKVVLPGHYADGSNLLHLAILGRNEDIIKAVLKEGLNPNQLYGKDKKSPLHLAAQKCLTESVALLIKKGANVNYVDQNKNSPLHLATHNRCYGTTVLLLDKGADPNLKNKHGNIAKDLLKKGSEDFKQYFEIRTRSPASKK